MGNYCAKMRSKKKLQMTFYYTATTLRGIYEYYRESPDSCNQRLHFSIEQIYHEL